MIEPIKAGDLCEVIRGLGNQQSPNIGLFVTVRNFQGEHSRFGRIWRCDGAGVRQYTDSGDTQVTGWGDFAQDWLRKLPPQAAPNKATETVNGVSA